MGTITALARRGHQLTLLMPRGRHDPELSPSDLRRYFQCEGDFELIQRPSPWAGDALKRTLLWLRQVFRDPGLRRHDLLYSRIPAMLGLGALPPLPFVTDHYRPWPDELRVIRPLVRMTARNRRCLGLVLHSAYAARAYERAGVDSAKILVAHNGAELERHPPPTKAAARIALDLPTGRMTAVYAGRLNAEKGLDQLLALAALRPDVLFVLVGSEGEGAIEQAARPHANVRIVPWQEPAALPVWLAAADVLLIPASRAPLETFRNCVLPLKLFAYLAAGRPILAPATPDLTELLHDRENALLVPPDDPLAAAAALDELLRSPELIACLSQAALATAGELTWDARAEKLERFLEPRLEAFLPLR